MGFLIVGLKAVAMVERLSPVIPFETRWDFSSLLLSSFPSAVGFCSSPLTTTHHWFAPNAVLALSFEDMTMWCIGVPWWVFVRSDEVTC